MAVTPGARVLALSLVLCLSPLVAVVYGQTMRSSFNYMPAPEGLFAYRNSIIAVPAESLLYIAGGSSFNGTGTLIVFSCDLVALGAKCSKHFLSAAVGLGLNSGFSPTVLYEPASRSIIVLSHKRFGSFGSNPLEPWLIRCSRQLTGCVLEDLYAATAVQTVGFAGFKDAETTRPIMYLHEPSSSLVIVGVTTGYEVAAYQCSAATLSSCTAMRVPGHSTGGANIPMTVLTRGATDATVIILSNWPLKASVCTLPLGLGACTAGAALTVSGFQVYLDGLTAVRDTAHIFIAGGAGSIIRCSSALSSCQYGPAPMVSVDYRYGELMLDADSGKMYLFNTASAPDLKLVVLHCEVDSAVAGGLSNCLTDDLSTANYVGAYSGVRPWVTLDATTGTLFAVTDGFGVYSATCNGASCIGSCPSNATTSSYRVSQVAARPLDSSLRRFEVTAGTPFSLALVTRNERSIRSRCAADLVSLAVVNQAALVVTASSVVNTGSTQFDLSVTIGRGSVGALRVLLNGAEAVPGPLELVVLPAAVSASESRFVVTGANATVVTELVEINVAVRDVFGNPHLSGLAASDFELSVAPPFASFTAAEHTGDGVYRVLANVTRASVFVLTVRVRGVTVSGESLLVVGNRCAPGTSHLLRTDACSPCALDTFVDTSNAIECRACPSHSWTAGASGARSVLECRARDGYARSPHSDSEFLACPSRAMCVSGGCASGHVGTLCKDCADGWYAGPNYSCERCPPSPRSMLFVYASAIALMALVAFFMVLVALARSAARESAQMSMANSLRSRAFPPSVSLAILAFQVLGVLAGADFNWTSTSKRALATFAVFSFETSYFVSECSLDTFASKYTVALVSPPLFTLVLALVWALYRLARSAVVWLSARPLLTLGELLRATLFLVGPLAYLPLARATLLLFACTRIKSGGWYLSADMRVQCWSGTHWQLVPVGIAAAVVYVIALPAAMALLLGRARSRLFSDPRIVRAYASAYKLMRQPLALFPVALLLKRLGFVLVALFLAQSPTAQALAYLVVLGLTGIAQASIRPYYYPLYDRFELVACCCYIGLLGVGMLSVTSSGSDNTLLSLTLIGLVLVLLVTAVGTIAVDVSDLWRNARVATTDDNFGPQDRLVREFLAGRMCDVNDIDALVRQLADVRTRTAADSQSGSATDAAVSNEIEFRSLSDKPPR